MTVVEYHSLSKGVRPMKSATKRLARHSGRNHQGRITMRHQGGGHKRLYREVDFSGGPRNVAGRVETIEYDPYRTAFIMRVAYRNGAKRYVLAPDGIKVGDQISFSSESPLAPGCRTELRRIPAGTFVHNVELRPERGGQLARAAGVSVQVLANEDGMTLLKLSSGETRKVSWSCVATIGQMSNRDHNLTVIGKAGRSRWIGIRPTVRGKVMNPRDHPYGGGEGRTQRGTRRPKTKWGKITGGRKTRNPKKWSNTLIVKRRK